MAKCTGISLDAKWAGFRKIGEKVVQHQKRKYGKTKYGLDRFYKGYLDLLTITFTSRFGKTADAFFRALGKSDLPGRIRYCRLPGL